MTLKIRPPQSADYGALAEIHNSQNEPDWHTTPERLATADAHAASTRHFRRLVMEKSGRIIATGTIHPDFGDPPLPGKRWVYLYSHPEHRGTGIDRQLLEYAVERDSGSITEVATTIRDDFVNMTSFLDSGFEELYRTWGSHLNLARFDIGEFEALITQLQAEGIRFVPYSDLPQTSAFAKQVVAFQREMEKDSLAAEPVIPRQQDDLYSEYAMPETLTLALAADNEIIGISSLIGPARGEMIEIGFTGVARQYRNRGIGTALDALTAVRAQELGFLDLNAAGAGTDSPNMRVKRKLGFVIEPAWITFLRKYSGMGWRLP